MHPLPESSGTNGIQPVPEIYSAAKQAFADQKDHTPPSKFVFIRENTPKAGNPFLRVRTWLEDIDHESLDMAEQHDVCRNN